MSKKDLPDKEWKKKLTKEEYHLLREKGTEKAFSGEYWDSTEEGTYVCAGCGEPLFSSEAKFKSNTGWPSFIEPIDIKNVTLKDDVGFFTKRTEVLCSYCQGHLGHLFHDGPKPAKTRYCINSGALKLKKKKS
ncbi:MAG: peptide-methionine (R)-S-oxide reductase MsrB [Verrucomicrobia bacterium]|nr:peptide-methionine (R)-S-oxide reductase MsrB [Verrucomicrobiota bacterium]